MAYRFEQEDSSVAAGIRRIALQQIDEAIREINRPADDRDAVIHDLRKRCKKLRGLVCLVRPVFDGYADENKAFRDAARALSVARDAEVLRQTYDLLAGIYKRQIDRPALATVRRRLTFRRQEAMRDDDIDERLKAFRGAVIAARKRCQTWRLDADDFDALSGGLGKTYKRARKAMIRARADGTAEAFHDWRKRVKYHWYHARLLSPIWPEPIKAHRKIAHDLGDMLGEYHDLAEFYRILGADPEAYGASKDVEALCGLARERQAVLEARAFLLGERLLAESTGALVGRWATYWNLWREEEKNARASSDAA